MTERIRSIRDLKGKTAAVTAIGGPAQLFLAATLSYVGVNPDKDVKWVSAPAAELVRMLAEGKVDAYMALPPDPQELGRKRSVMWSLTAPWIALVAIFLLRGGGEPRVCQKESGSNQAGSARDPQIGEHLRS